MRKVFNTDIDTFFKQYCSILGTMLGLRKQEILVLAELLIINNELKELPEDVRNKILFDYDNKIRIREKVGDISSASLYNIFTSLRKVGVIRNNKLSKNISIYPEKSFELKFIWEIAERSRVNNQEQSVNAESNYETSVRDI